MANTYTAIATVTVDGSAPASIEFTSIPATYTDLCVLLSARGARAAVSTIAIINFNSSTSNLSHRRLLGNGSAASSDNNATVLAFNFNGSTGTSATFGNATIYVPNYASSNAKSVSIDAVTENNATSAQVQLLAGLWNDTSAITSLKITAVAGDLVTTSTLDQYSTATLYGIKNS